MRIEKCYFCSKPVYPGHGITFARNDAKLFRFCSSKCHKHFKAKHNPRKMKWTKAYRKTHAKDMTIDSTFEFEKKRDEPLIYNRDRMVKTVQAIKKIQKIRERRERDYIMQRIKAGKNKLKNSLARELERDVDLLKGDLKTVIKSKIAAQLEETKEETFEEPETIVQKIQKKKKAQPISDIDIE